MATRFPVGSATLSFDFQFCVSWSVAKRLRAHMAIDSLTSRLRHALSHGRAQACARTEGRGAFSLITAAAST